MNKKILPIITILYIISYIAIPLILINYMNDSNANKTALFIILLTAFCSFSINILFSYIFGKNIFFPIISVIIAFAMFIVFNKSVLIVIVIISILSFLGHFLGTIFTKRN